MKSTAGFKALLLLSLALATLASKQEEGQSLASVVVIHTSHTARAQHALHKEFMSGEARNFNLEAATRPIQGLDLYNQGPEHYPEMSTSGLDPRCPIGSIAHKMSGFENVCAWKPSPETSWNQAEALCMQDGGHIGSFKNGQELFFLQSLLSFREQFWVGLHRLDPHQWEFTDATNPDFAEALWAPGEPNNGAEGCAEMVPWAGTGETNRMNDRSCADKLPYVCLKTLPEGLPVVMAQTDGVVEEHEEGEEPAAEKPV